VVTSFIVGRFFPFKFKHFLARLPTATTFKNIYF